MTRTSNYQLCQWAASDQIHREDFNADNQKIDQAIAGKASIVIGTYTGTGNNGSSNPNSLDFADTLGKAPKLLIISKAYWSTDLMLLINGMTSQSSVRGYNSGSASGNTVAWTGTGVSWYNTHQAEYQFNASSTTYYYCAIA